MGCKQPNIQSTNKTDYRVHEDRHCTLYLLTYLLHGAESFLRS